MQKFVLTLILAILCLMGVDHYWPLRYMQGGYIWNICVIGALLFGFSALFHGVRLFFSGLISLLFGR